MSEVYIRSQERKSLHVLNSAGGIKYVKEPDRDFLELHIESEDDQKEKHSLYLYGVGMQYKLGEYESEKRCIEILDEIQKTCGTYMYAEGSEGLFTGSNSFSPVVAEIPRIYEMPER